MRYLRCGAVLRYTSQRTRRVWRLAAPAVTCMCAHTQNTNKCFGWSPCSATAPSLAHTHMHSRKCTHANAKAHTHTQRHTHTHTLTQMHARERTHARAYRFVLDATFHPWTGRLKNFVLPSMYCMLLCIGKAQLSIKPYSACRWSTSQARRAGTAFASRAV